MTMPDSADPADLAAIRARFVSFSEYGEVEDRTAKELIFGDIPALFKEVERLRAELEDYRLSVRHLTLTRDMADDRVATLRKALEGAKRYHEDRCSKYTERRILLQTLAGRAVVQEKKSGLPCDCGADEHNAKIDAALRGKP